MMTAKRIEKMLELQNNMNSAVNPNWKEQGWGWHTAAWMEASEMLDHYGWKWWKKQDPDMAQVKMELVDIWHFGLSNMLERYNPANELSLSVEIADQLINSLEAKPVNMTFTMLVEEFVKSCVMFSGFSIGRFGMLMSELDMSFDELYTMYVGKNVLNRFRQDNGYKEGTYHKEWYGMEDNVQLEIVLNNLDKTVLDVEKVIYDKLNSVYVSYVSEMVPGEEL